MHNSLEGVTPCLILDLPTKLKKKSPLIKGDFQTQQNLQTPQNQAKGNKYISNPSDPHNQKGTIRSPTLQAPPTLRENFKIEYCLYRINFYFIYFRSATLDCTNNHYHSSCSHPSVVIYIC